MFYNRFTKIHNMMLSIKISDKQRDTAITYTIWIYGGIVCMSTIYGIKKGIQKWLTWKDSRHYKKISNDTIESLIDIACDGGTLAFYSMAYGVSSAIIASTAPISIPLLHFFRLDRSILPETFSTDSLDSMNSSNHDIDYNT